MNFLIQTIDGEIKHDFSFSLIESIRYKNWYNRTDEYKYKTIDFTKDSDLSLLERDYIPVGANDFVIAYIKKYFDKTPKPINIPKVLNKIEFIKRNVIFGKSFDITKKSFVKSIDKIKGFTGIVSGEKELLEELNFIKSEDKNFMISDLIDIDSEWRAFVYKNKLVGLQNYSGEFTVFPNVNLIKEMIGQYENQPIAYTIDVGINNKDNFLIEVHDFFSCGLYGFNDARILPNMFSDWFNEYIKL